MFVENNRILFDSTLVILPSVGFIGNIFCQFGTIADIGIQVTTYKVRGRLVGLIRAR